MESAFGYNSELPGGRSPYWIKDEAMLGMGLAPGDAVSVDSRDEPSDGDLVLAEVEVDGDSQKMVRRFRRAGEEVVLESDNPSFPSLRVSPDQMFVIGVVRTRVRYEPADQDRTRIVEESLS